MTELIWDGKYDTDGRRVAPLRVPLPFQTVETVNESSRDRQLSLERFQTGRDPEWRNRLIWGDKKYVLPSLLQEFGGQVRLIYIDPPFDTGANFSYQVEIDSESFTKEPSIIEMKAFRDTWKSYLQWMYETLAFLRELLAEDGSILVHTDWHVSHYAKLLLDEVFGRDHFMNEVIWYYRNVGLKVKAKRFHNVTESIFWYSKGQSHTYHEVYEERAEISRQPEVEWDPIKRKTVTKKDEHGNVIYRDLTDRRVQNLWDIPRIGPTSGERANFDTQKPKALLARAITALSNEDDLVLDCFVGSGTTAVVAEELGRRWIACDLSRFAIHTTRKRLLELPHVKPFVVQNLGKYERQVWQAAEFGEEAEAKQAAYRRFILELYKSRPIAGYVWLHGVRSGRMVHIGAVDSPISPGDVSQIATEFRRAVGSGKDAPTVNGVDILGWDFAFELNEVAKQQAAQAKIDVRFLRIPRDVMDKRAVEQGDIRFFELAALSLDLQKKARTITVAITDFVIPPDDVPEDVRRAITHWEQWIDYWAVDWDNTGDPFHNQWQDYRTREKHTIRRSVSHTYEQPGEYTIIVKVIDILGNDTTKSLKVKVMEDASTSESRTRATLRVGSTHQDSTVRTSNPGGGG